MTPQLPSQASFVDDFDRPDTTLGLGEGWDVLGADDTNNNNDATMLAATDGFIRDGHYTYAGESSVRAVRQFSGTVRGMGTVGRFREIGDADAAAGNHETTLSMVISPDDKLTTDMVEFTAHRWGWALRVRRASGAFQSVMAGKFSPNLALDVDYQFEFEVAGDNVTVRIPGSEVTRNVPTAGLLGDRAYWGERVQHNPPAGVVFDFGTVWAVEDGQPLFPVGG
jgi:hypothetical protein